MKIDVRMTTKYDSPALRRFAEKALIQKLGPSARQVNSVGIRLKDVNGPRGGIDKLCIVRLALFGGGEVVTRGESASWYDAIAIALWSARTTLDRRLDKKKQQGLRERRGGRSMDWVTADSRREFA